MSDYLTKSGLQVHHLLVDFVEKEALPGGKVSADQFWSGLAALVADHGPTNVRLLNKRDQIQSQIDDWHRKYGPVANNPKGYEFFLKDIGYLLPEPEDFTIETTGLDPEITTLCGPQLVVPVSNARYALNAANARWGSLYDAFYGTDIISREGDLAPGKGYNVARGAAVVDKAAQFLDDTFPLTAGSHRDVTGYHIVPDGARKRLAIDTANGPVALADAAAFVGYGGTQESGQIVLRHNGLHVILVIEP
ncbi:MAG TPA: malate synthase G, partial [Devosia sp.]|nr:malate synthase G [Devosia sp.]